MNRLRGRISIARPSRALGPSEIRRTVSPEVADVPDELDDAAFSEGMRYGALGAALLACGAAAVAFFFS